MDTIFRPTHRITTDRETFDVMLVDGVAYTSAEWDSTAAADYELQDDGRWTFQGQPFDGTVETILDETDWYWIDGTPYCPACVECDTPALDAAESTRGPCYSGRCACCGQLAQTA